MPGHVCIVTSGSLASNPRVLKEAGALREAGYEVTTLICDYSKALHEADDALVAEVPWKVIRVPRPSGERYRGAVARLAAHAFDKAALAVPLAIAAAAYGGPAGVLRRAALDIEADLYIAHYVVALPAAAAAARSHGGMMGFDAEDFHSGEGGESEAETFRMKLVRRIEGALLPTCRHVTAAAPLISAAYRKAYGISPTTLLNVFPLMMAPDAPSPASSGGLRAYWFSQTVGLDRGLQSFLQAMARAKAKITLDIRGSDRWRHGETLLALARDLGIGDRVKLLPVAAPEEMVRLAALYDLGLSLETNVTENRRLCLTNKIFTYLLAGVPVVMSDTPAQSALAPDLGAAAELVALGEPQAMADALDRLAEPAVLAEAKATAWRLGHARYNWDKEKILLLEAVASAFRAKAR